MSTRIGKTLVVFNNGQDTNLPNKFNESGPYYTSYPSISGWTEPFGHVVMHCFVIGS